MDQGRRTLHKVIRWWKIMRANRKRNFLTIFALMLLKKDLETLTFIQQLFTASAAHFSRIRCAASLWIVFYPLFYIKLSGTIGY